MSAHLHNLQPLLFWPPDVARYNMEGLVFVSSAWLKTACVVLALFWVAFRAYRVLSKPVEELVNLLGLEVPVAPLVSLAGIKADGVLLHWKPPDQRASVVKYVIRINGIDIGDVAPQETSVTIENLQPDHHYVIRIVTLNTANFQAPSVPIRLRTLAADSEQFYSTTPQKEQRETQDEDYTPTPIIRTNKNLVDVMAPPHPAPTLTREHSNSVTRTRRADTVRRNSPASQTAEQARSAQEAADSMESIKVLTEKLNSLRQELEEMERLIQDEEEEFVTAKALLVEKRDEKRAALKEKDEVSRDLRKEVATLERTNAAAQTRKAHQEKLLRQKEAERKKARDDVARWARETIEMRDATEALRKERVEYEESAQARIHEAKERLAQELQTNKSLEDVIREKGTQIKVLEEQRKRLEEGEDGGEAQDGAEITEAEEARHWDLHLRGLQNEYTETWSHFSEAERMNHDAQHRLHFLQQRRSSIPQMSGTAPEFVPAQRPSPPQPRPISMQEPLASNIPGGFIQSTAAPFNSGVTTTSPGYSNITPYFNPVNGMALPPPPSARNLSFSQAEIESLTGGAPMSPTAGALLPSGLFGDEPSGFTDAEDNERDFGPPQQSHNPSPNLHHILPGLGAPGTFERGDIPSSPTSVHSKSPFASPRDSAGQLGYYPSNENTGVDSDRRSVRSTSSSFKNPPNTRFGSLFGLHRQRGKTISDQGPPLGSLKPSQSQSLPRQEAGDLDPIGTQGRRGSHSSGAWYNAFMPTRTNTLPAESSSSESPNHVATRKRAFNMFGMRGDPWLTSASGHDRPSSPRQGSTNSADALGLPRPSTESQARFGWALDAHPARNSPLGVDWSVNNTSTSSWSRLGSRRPSVQHGSSVSLINEDLLNGDLPDVPTSRSPTQQAPIGTRPQSSASYMPPSGMIPPTPPKQLNPAAPQFTSLFGREDKAEKAKKAAEKAADKEAKKAEKEARKADKSSRKGKEKATVAPEDDTDPRRSRDSRSITTVDYSDASPRESLEQTISLTPSDSPHLTPFNKESFMQKLSRKSSTSQFLQFGKGKNFLSKKSSEAITPDEVDEDHGRLMLRDTDSPGHSPSIGTPKDKSSALSWSSIKRMGKRGDKTPSLHESIASETTGDEDESHERETEGYIGNGTA